jgi:hypothetical protein
MRTLFLTLTMCLLAVPVCAKYSGGSGEPNDPYQIATAADLIALGETPEDYDKHFVLTADIDLDPKLPGRKVFDKAVIAPDTDPNDKGWEFQGTPFTGVLDGNAHTISHLTIKGKDYVGLFGQLGSGAEVKDLGVMDVSVISSGYCVGGLVGYNEGSVAQCYSTGAVNGTAYSVGGLVGSSGTWGASGMVTQCYSTGAVTGGSGVGGLVGSNQGTVTECYSTGAVSGDGSVGGLVGCNNNEFGGEGIVTQCYSTGAVSSAGGYVGGLVGYNYDGSVTQCYSTGAVSGDSVVGGLVGTNSPFGCVNQCYSSGTVSGTSSVGGLVGVNETYCENAGRSAYCWSGSVIDCFWDIQTSGQAKSAGGTGKTTAQMHDAATFMAAGWDFVGQADGPSDLWAMPEGGGYPIVWWQLSPWPSLPRFSGGTGEPNDPYRISTAKDLNSIGYNPRLMKCHFKLVADLDLTGFHFYAIGDNDHPYGGVFDGNAKTIKNLRNSLFGFVSGLIKDLRLLDPNCIDSPIQTNRGTIASCSVQGGSVWGDGGLVGFNGGLVGSNSGIVSQCYSTGAVSGTYWVGGLVGSNDGSLTECYCSGTVSGNGSVGGLVAQNAGTVTQCYSTGAVNSSGSTVGGLVGYNRTFGTVTQCYSTGVVSGGVRVGGLAAENDGHVTYCYSAGAVSGTERVGGLVGEDSYGTVTQCYSSGTVTGTSSVGGLVGSGFYGSVTASFWDTQTSGQTTSAGGTGKTTAQMCDPNTFRAAGWDFVGQADGLSDMWGVPVGGGDPILWWQLSPWPSLPRFSGGTGEPNDPYRISTVKDLNSIGYNPRLMRCHFKLLADLDLTGSHFYPMGSTGFPYGGVFDGDGHTISHLTIKGGGNLGLFGYLGSGAEVRELGLADADVAGSGDHIGGLVGSNSGTVTQCHSTGVVMGTRSYVGGLVGYNLGTGTVSQCCSTGAVSGTGQLVGGLVGSNDGIVICCHSTGAVSGDSLVGGLAGTNGRSGCVNQCYSSGTVSGAWDVGGLVGYTEGGSVTQCYSAGVVSGTGSHVGGLVGSGSAKNVIASFWDIQTAGQTTSVGGTGKTTAQMQTARTFLDAGWDFVGETKNGTADLWWILEGRDYPRLWWEAHP